MSATKETLLVVELCQQIGPLLHGRGPSVQGAVLADLLAMWIAGHAPPLRQEMLDEHIKAVRDLIPVNARIIAERMDMPDWVE